MDKRIKALWIEALESGEYKQSTGSLRYTPEDSGEPKFCCLGVLCEVAIKDGLDIEFDPEGETYDGCSAFLPEKVQHWAGLEDEGGYVRSVDSGYLQTHVEYTVPGGDYGYTEEASTLLTLNDAAMWPFEKIAKVIDEQF